MRVKICGITNLEDAIYAVSCGADALGFVFYPPSPRYIEPERAAKIIEELPPFVEKVGLFVNESAQDIEKMAHTSGISLAQLHFDIDEEFADSIDFPTIPVVRAKSAEDIDRFSDRYRLVDAWCESYGGSGKRLNIEWFDGRDNSKIILAGGLDAQNVGNLAGYGFYAVDVSSGTEAARGKKDPEKVRKFIENAKAL